MALVAIHSLAFASTLAAAPPAPESTWTPLAALPERLDSPVFAIAVSPTDAQTVLVGTAGGSIYRSTDGGAAWKQVRRDLGRGVLSLAFNPYRPGAVLAGTRGQGAWRSVDGGLTWGAQPGLERVTARGFGFAKSLAAAATDHGVFVDREGSPWTQAGLAQLDVASIAVAAVNDPSRLVAGADASQGGEPLPVYQSSDGGGTWSSVNAPASASSMVAALAAGPLPPGADQRPLLMGTSGGVYLSNDNGAGWQQLSGAGSLPPTDFNQVAFAGGHADHLYVASDGGASQSGGLWSSTDGGQHFGSLKPPVPAVTALAVSADDPPTLYVATFRPADHAVMLWSYRDTGQPPQPPAGGLPAVGSAAKTASAPAPAPVRPSPRAWLAILLRGPEGPYLVLGGAAVVVLLLALVAYLRRGRS